jgi:3-oxoacyl-[acyl-carrier protein] reductase
MLLRGKNIVITGSGRGIGKSVAIACANQGANIALTARSNEELIQVKKEVEMLGINVKVSLKAADVTNYEEIRVAFDFFRNELGLINGVIANAGTSWMGTTHDFDIHKFSYILSVNILGVFHTFKAAYPHLKMDDKNDKARFIITGSAAYPNAMPKFAAYAASKYATVGLQKALSLEYKKENINFNQILPTMVDTKLLRGRKAGDGNKPDNVMDPSDLNDYYIFLLSEFGNKISDQLITPNDFEDAKKLIQEAPLEKKANWEVFKDFLSEKAPKVYENVKKQWRLIEFFLNN